LFAALNLFGAALVAGSLSAGAPYLGRQPQRPFWAGWSDHLRNAQLLSLYGIGFLVLFAFIGVFSYVGFVLAAPPFALSMTALGLVFLVFVPSMITTPAAGRIAQRLGPARALSCSLLLALLSLPLLTIGSLPAMITGLTLVGIGTFFAQAVATGSVGRAARQDRAAASGLYLSAYYCGGLAGAAAIGQIFARFGWLAALLGVGTALALAAVMGTRLRTT
jgi:MFS transporter, YNFM family, putative membrane transport protein